jgi:hypothetical protein
MPATSTNLSGAQLHPMSTHTDKSVKTTKHTPERYESIYVSTETPQVDQAIDQVIIPGVTSSRKIIQLQTPSGMKPVICMAENEISSSNKRDFTLSVPLNELGFTWGPSSFVDEMINGFLGLRTLYLMNMFKYYRSNLIVRLVSKPPLFQAQRFWVSFTPDTESKVANRLGFEWNPSECNEVFVLIPWTSTAHMLPVTSASMLDFGDLSVTPVSSLVTETGLPAPLQISAYICPADMQLFVPLPVTTTVHQAGFSTTETISLVADQEATLTVSTPFYVSPTLISQQGEELDYTVEMGGLVIASRITVGENINTFNSLVDQVITAAGSYIIRSSADLSNLSITCFGTSDVVAVLTVDPTLRNVVKHVINHLTPPPIFQQQGAYTDEPEEGFLVSLESYSNIPTYNDLIDNTKTFMDWENTREFNDTLPHALYDRVEIDPSFPVTNYNMLPILGDMYVLKLEGPIKTRNLVVDAPLIGYLRDDHGEVFHYDDRLGYVLAKVVNSDNVCYMEPINNGLLSNEARTALSIIERKRYKHLYQSSITSLEQQIFEYAYNEKTDQHEKDFGKMTDHSIREDTHWQLLDAFDVANGDDGFSFTWTPLLNTATKEMFRHFIVAQTPIFKFTTTSNPSTNVMLRLTQLTDLAAVTLDEALQLPGKEWDIKTGPMIVRPFWQSPTSGLLTDNLTFTLQGDIIGGTIGTTFSVEVWLNTSTLEYHHLQDPDVKSITTLSYKNTPKPKYDSMGFTTCCGASVCVCNRTYQRTNKFVQQIAEDESLPETLPQSAVLDGTADISQITNAELTSEIPDAGVITSEQRWSYVASFDVDPVTTSMVRIPVNNSIFGKYPYVNSSRYRKWKGTPRLDIMTSASSTTNAHVFVVHDNVPIDVGAVFDVKDFLRMFPTAIKLVNDKSIELDLKWRRTEPVALVRRGQSSVADLGYVDICIPAFTPPLITGANNLIQFTIYCDVSDVQYEHPVGFADTLPWAGISITEYARS